MKIIPVTVCNYGWCRYCWKTGNIAGLFRNRDEVKLSRWGFFVLGFEVGSRNPGDRFGLLLKRLGLWPW